MNFSGAPVHAAFDDDDAAVPPPPLPLLLQPAAMNVTATKTATADVRNDDDRTLSPLVT